MKCPIDHFAARYGSTRWFGHAVRRASAQFASPLRAADPVDIPRVMLIERWASQEDLRPRGCRAGAAKGGRHRRVSHGGVDLRLRRAMPGEVPQTALERKADFESYGGLASLHAELGRQLPPKICSTSVRACFVVSRRFHWPSWSFSAVTCGRSTSTSLALGSGSCQHGSGYRRTRRLRATSPRSNPPWDNTMKRSPPPPAGYHLGRSRLCGSTSPHPCRDGPTRGRRPMARASQGPLQPIDCEPSSRIRRSRREFWV